jgi:hypothetical protein
MIDNCFEIDWESSKIEKVLKIKSEIDAVKAYLKTQYKYLRDVYKYHAGLATARVVSVGSGIISEILSHCNEFIDGRQLKLSDVDLEVIACNGGKRESNYLSPDKSLVRFQFMEVLVRLSVAKYFKTGKVESASEAVIKAFEDNFHPYIADEKFNSHIWRKE